MKRVFRVMTWYRASRWLHERGLNRLSKLITLLIRLIFTAYIPGSALIGRGTRLAMEGMGTALHSRAVIGQDCIIGQLVTIGGTSQHFEVPVLGDRVFVGNGARILGPVHIGSDVVIGANAVVLADVPDGSVAVGIPARVVKSGVRMSDYI